MRGADANNVCVQERSACASRTRITEADEQLHAWVIAMSGFVVLNLFTISVYYIACYLYGNLLL